MRIEVLTIFPDFFRTPLETSILRRGLEADAWSIGIHDIREFAREGIHRQVDDTPAGGGPGMVLMCDPIARNLEALGIAAGSEPNNNRPLVLLSASGPVLTQQKAEQLAKADKLVLICGHYEGVDERLLSLFPIDELSIGDYVLTGGETAALVVLESVIRLLPEVLGNPESLREESFQDQLLDHPVYTKPAEYRGLAVPEVLLSGHHANIAQWRRQQALLKTARNRPDLLAQAQLSKDDRAYLRGEGIDL